MAAVKSLHLPDCSGLARGWHRHATEAFTEFDNCYWPVSRPATHIQVWRVYQFRHTRTTVSTTRPVAKSPMGILALGFAGLWLPSELGRWPVFTGFPSRSARFLAPAFASFTFPLDGALHHVDGGSIKHRLDVSGIEFLDHLDAGAAVLGDLIDVCTLHKAEADVGVTEAVARSHIAVAIELQLELVRRVYQFRHARLYVAASSLALCTYVAPNAVTTATVRLAVTVQPLKIKRLFQPPRQTSQGRQTTF